MRSLSVWGSRRGLVSVCRSQDAAVKGKYPKAWGNFAFLVWVKDGVKNTASGAKRMVGGIRDYGLSSILG